MEHSGLTKTLGNTTPLNTVAEIQRPILESLASVLGPNSRQAELLNEAKRHNWQCRVFKLRDGTFQVVPN